jgi:hypothetical protein
MKVAGEQSIHQQQQQHKFRNQQQISSVNPTLFPFSQPSIEPSIEPSSQPSIEPSIEPSAEPSSFLSISPSNKASSSPSIPPSASPSFPPSTYPSLSFVPSLHPSTQPSTSIQPSTYPSFVPSSQPSILPSYTIKNDAIIDLEMIIHDMKDELESTRLQDEWRQMTSHFILDYWTDKDNISDIVAIDTFIIRQDIIYYLNDRDNNNNNDSYLKIKYIQEYQIRQSVNSTIPTVYSTEPFIAANTTYMELLRSTDDIFQYIAGLNIRIINTQPPSFQPSNPPSISSTTTTTTGPPIRNNAIVIWSSVLVCLIALMVITAVWFLFIHNRYKYNNNNNNNNSRSSTNNNDDDDGNEHHSRRKRSTQICVWGEQGNSEYNDNGEQHQSLTGIELQERKLQLQQQESEQQQGQRVGHLFPIRSESEEEDDDDDEYDRRQNLDENNGIEVVMNSTAQAIHHEGQHQEESNLTILVSERRLQQQSQLGSRNDPKYEYDQSRE